MSGSATATIVEFSGISVAASDAATRRTPRRVAGTVSDTGDRASLEQEELAVAEGELDVMVGRAEDLVTLRRQRVQGHELSIAETEGVDLAGVDRHFLRRVCVARVAPRANRDVLVAQDALELAPTALEAVAGRSDQSRHH